MVIAHNQQELNGCRYTQKMLLNIISVTESCLAYRNMEDKRKKFLSRT